MYKFFIIFSIILIVVLLDQSLKIWVKTNMQYGEEISIVGDRVLLHFVENNGMAFGVSFGGKYGKLLLTLGRLIALNFLFFYLFYLLKNKAPLFKIIGISMIIAGALGNIVDSFFYGVIFSESPYYGGLAELFPIEGGYSSLLHGKVVDMLYFPLLHGYFPDWIPIKGGQEYFFFKPVFNISDLSLTYGVLIFSGKVVFDFIDRLLESN